MDRLRGRVAWISLALVVGVAGCHLTGALPVDLGAGHGRVDRTYTATLANSVRAAIGSLDDLGVHPKELSIRAIDAVSPLGKPGWAAETNAEYLPDDQSFRDLFDKHEMNVAGAEPIYFNPVLVTYKGETEDGQTVNVVVRSQPPDASETMIMTRVGRDGDEAWGKKYLDRVTERINLLTKQTLPALPPPVAK